jgi:hypothetical protein
VVDIFCQSYGQTLMLRGTRAAAVDLAVIDKAIWRFIQRWFVAIYLRNQREIVSETFPHLAALAFHVIPTQL